jgi:hypothetical protein
MQRDFDHCWSETMTAICLKTVEVFVLCMSPCGGWAGGLLFCNASCPARCKVTTDLAMHSNTGKLPVFRDATGRSVFSLRLSMCVVKLNR